MNFPLVPAELAFAGDGTPFSPRYGDIYHSSHGGLEQARHVFLAGNDLPARWDASSRFVVFETGFGVGLNFLATWQAWREHQGSPERRLHYVSVEKHPFRLDDLRQLHQRWPELGPLAAELHAQWPLPLPGLHRLEFGDVILTLCFGDAAKMLPQLSLAADAIYLDGFSPERNPDLWSDAVLSQLPRLAAPGATFSTWSVAGDVRRGLARAGFELERRPGFGGKREMLVGHSAGRPSTVVGNRPRRIAVIGAGIAGATIAHALTRRGHEVTVLDRAAAPASGASGNLAGVFRPLPSLDDSLLSRLLRSGFLYGRRQFGNFAEARCGWTGALHIARDLKHEEMQQRIATEHALPDEFCRFVSREDASAVANWPVALGGWWFPQAGWINPPSLCRALLAKLECRYNFEVRSIDRTDKGWRIGGTSGFHDTDGVVLANAVGAPALASGYPLPIRAGRGLVSHIPEAATAPMNVVATRLGYVTPPLDGYRCAGATLAVDDPESAPRPSDHAENLLRLEMLLPGYANEINPASLDGRVSFRPMSPDRLPIVGPLSAGDDLWVINGFGARGLVFSSICAELLAGQMLGDPLPLENDLVRALDPQRFRSGHPRGRKRSL